MYFKAKSNIRFLLQTKAFFVPFYCNNRVTYKAKKRLFLRLHSLCFEVKENICKWIKYESCTYYTLEFLVRNNIQWCPCELCFIPCKTLTCKDDANCISILVILWHIGQGHNANDLIICMIKTQEALLLWSVCILNKCRWPPQRLQIAQFSCAAALIRQRNFCHDKVAVELFVKKFVQRNTAWHHTYDYRQAVIGALRSGFDGCWWKYRHVGLINFRYVSGTGVGSARQI